MSKLNTKQILKNVQSTLSKRSPEILTGIGIAGMVTTTVLAVTATPKAILLLNDRKDELETEKLPGVEIVKTTWKCYIPAAITGAMSITCLIGASKVNLKRNAALATAYRLSEKALTEYKDAVIETVGEKKEKIIREKVAEEQIKKDPVANHDVIITGRGSTLCYDGVFGKYFESDVESIKRAINAINRKINFDMYASLNDFYSELGVETIPAGEDLGWKIDDGMLDVDFSSRLTEDGRPCLVIRYTIAPKYDYYKFV